MENKKNLLDKEKTTKQNRIWVRISSACNNKCNFCLDSDAQNWTLVDEKIVKNKIKEWFKNWYENRVIISWWEASINPKFPEYIRYAKELGYDRVQTVTNGNMFAVASFCDKVIDAWLEEITFSFHGHNPTLHDYLVVTPWAFKKSLKWLIYIKKNYPDIIINIDIVVNKINIKYLPDIVKFFMKLWVYEYDILQIIPFWRWFSENKNKLFYNVQDNIEPLHKTWELSKVNGMYMWTNRFPVEAFEWYEDLIQDPRKIKSEVMWEGYDAFEKFIKSNWVNKTDCFWEACDVCFQKQYCHDFIDKADNEKITYNSDYELIEWEEFPSLVYEKYWENWIDFKEKLRQINKKLINIPKCLWWEGIYQAYNDIKEEKTLEDYTYKYIKDLYRKKSLRCKGCIYNDDCEWIHINFIRSYGFSILEPIKKAYSWTPVTINHYNRFFKYIEKHVKKSQSILEIGCNYWLGVQYLSWLWYRVLWLDNNEKSINYWLNKGINVKQLDICDKDKLLNMGRFDIIYLVNIINDDLYNEKYANYKGFFINLFDDLYNLLDKKWKIIFNFQEINALFVYKDLLSITNKYKIYEGEYDDNSWKDIFLILEKK